MAKQMFYDPPAGWRYGFPKPYKPLPGELLDETLRRDGYPQFEINNRGAYYVRFWESEVEDGEVQEGVEGSVEGGGRGERP